MNITWKKVPYYDEKEEFRRTAKFFSDDPKSFNDNSKALEKFYNVANLTKLTEQIWRKLENTDSWETDTILKIQKAINVNSSSSGSRSIENVLKEFFNGSVRAPIVLQYDENKSYTLIAGNTRLMVARMLNTPVNVVLVKSDW